MSFNLSIFISFVCFSLTLNAQEKSEKTQKINYNGIYKTSKEGVAFSIKNDSAKTYKIDTVGFVSINRFKNLSNSFDYGGNSVLNVELDAIGKEEFSSLTGNNIGKPLAIIINNILYTAPIVNEKISGGQFVVTGIDSVEELEKLKRLIAVIKLRNSKDK